MTMTRDEAQRYVEGLFRFVLARRTINDDELQSWTDHLMRSGDPADVFFRFANSEENQRILTRSATTRTMYEHGHFYSPVVDTAEVVRCHDRIFAQRQPLGVALNTARQVETFHAVARHFPTLPFGDHPDGKHHYHYGNTSYGFGDACIYWGMLGHFRPSCIFEIGSGFTSALALDAITYFGLNTRCLFIDPYPELVKKVIGELDERKVVIPLQIQDIDPDCVVSLQSGDILFIDSSHVVKTGSDVCFELAELLPRLSPGVIVHFHDMFYPFEYPHKWVVEDNKSWNEVYFLHAFLQYNSEFEIIFYNDYFAKTHADLIHAATPDNSTRILLNPGGGLWLRRRGGDGP